MVGFLTVSGGSNRMRAWSAACLTAVLLSACQDSGSGPQTVATVPAGPNETVAFNEAGQALPASQTLSATQTLSCDKTSWFAGITELCAGHLIYRDYVYDDYGADVGNVSPNPTTPAVGNLASREGQNNNPFGANNPGLLSPTAGDQRYPVGSENTADLVTLDISLAGGAVKAVFQLNALFESGQTIAAIAVDTDNNPATGNVRLMGLVVKGADAVYEFSNGDVSRNLIEGSFPLPASDVWRVWAVTAKQDRVVMNVAFRGTGEQAGATGGVPQQVLGNLGNWWEDKQAAALMAGDVSAFNATVKTSELTAGLTRGVAIPTGFHQRVYTSRYTVPGSRGEGMVLQGLPGRNGANGSPCEQLFNYVGKYQPYGVYIPPAKSTPGKRGMQLVLHGCEANHASQINQPGMQKQFGDDLNRILVSPLGRGPYGFYSDISERDVLDVYDDIQTVVDVDTRQVFASGYSMGGYGASRFAMLYPDRFAGLHNWVGFTGDLSNSPLPTNPFPELATQFQAASGGSLPLSSRVGAVGNIIDFMGNLLNIPGTHSYAAADELVQVNTSLAWAARLGETAGVLYEFFLHLTAEHLTLIALDDWQKEASFSKNLVQGLPPPRVVYRTDASLAFPEYEIKHDKAYWLSEIVGRGAGFIDLDVSSGGCGRGVAPLASGQDAGNGPVPFVRTFRRLTGAVPSLASSNSLKATLVNVQAFRIDAIGSCLRPGTAYEITSDGPVTIRFSDGRTLSLPGGAVARGTI
jgi:pimeloyl-ACP methyl ester carboxylesterase